MLYSVAEHHVGKRFSPDAEQVMDMMVSLTQSHRQTCETPRLSIHVLIMQLGFLHPPRPEPTGV